jgi:hypothetical protein
MLTDRLENKHGTGGPTVRRLFDITQAADFAGVPIQEICCQIRFGKLKVYHLGGGRVRLDEADLLASIEPRELEW